MSLETALTYGPVATVSCLFALTALVVARLRARARGAVRPPPADGEEEGLEEGRRAVVGILRADGAPVALDPFEQVPAAVSAVTVGSDGGTVTSEGLVIESEGVSIRVVGDVVLRWGSDNACPGVRFRRLPATRREALERLTGEVSDPNAKPVFHTLRAGDRVRVVASFVRQADDTPGDYREPSHAWQARGGGDHPVALSFVGSARVRAPSLGRTIGVGALVLACASGGVYGLGRHTYRSLPDAYVEPSLAPNVLDSPDAWIAALSPWHNTRVGEWAQRVAGVVAPQSSATARRHVEITEAVSGCPDSLVTAVQHGLVDHAIERAEACGIAAPRSAFCRNARFEGLPATHRYANLSDSDPLQYLLADDRDAAVEAMRGMAVRERQRAAAGGMMAAYDERTAQNWDRLADGLLARQGDADARARLVADEADSAVARVLLADLATGDERVARAEALLHQSGSQRGAIQGLVLLAEQDPRRAAAILGEPLGRPFAPWGWERAPTAPRPGLRQAIDAVAATRGGSRRYALSAFLRLLRAWELTGQARLDAAADLLDAARTDLDEARRSTVLDTPRLPPEVLWELIDGWATQQAVLALERGDDRGAFAAAVDGSEAVQDRLRRWVEDRRRGVRPSEPWSWQQDFASGTELAQLFRPGDPLNQVTDPYRIPSVARDRAVLIDHLRWASDDLDGRCAAELRFERAAKEARVARALDAPDWLRHALGRVRRFDEALTRRDTAVFTYLATEVGYLSD